MLSSKSLQTRNKNWEALNGPYAEQISMGFYPKDIFGRECDKLPGTMQSCLGYQGAPPWFTFLSPIPDLCQSYSRETLFKGSTFYRKMVSFGLRCLSYKWKEARNSEMQNFS